MSPAGSMELHGSLLLICKTTASKTEILIS